MNIISGKVQTTSEIYKHRMQVNQDDTSLTALPTGSTPTADTSTTTIEAMPPLNDQTMNQTKDPTEDQTKDDHCEPQVTEVVGEGVTGNEEEQKEIKVEEIKTEGE